MTFAKTTYRTTTPEAVRDCLNAGMSIRRAAEHMGCSLHGLRAACSLFEWHPRGWSGPKPNNVQMPAAPTVSSVFTWGQR